MRRIFQILFLSIIFAGAVMSQNLTQYVNCFNGTGSNGTNTFPGAVAPFGMIQWSPDTKPGNPGSYNYGNSYISFFSLDHVSGAGCTYGQNFGFMPINVSTITNPPGSRTAFQSAFSHNNETARPGYYSVKFNNGIKVELTTTTRSGFGRFTFPVGSTETMMINAASAGNGASSSLIIIDTADQSVSGSARSKLFCGRTGGTTVYFYAQFNQPFASFSTWSGSVLTNGGTSGQGTSSGAFITFDTTDNRTVLVRLSISYVSAANAKLNMQTECPDSLFTPAGFDSTAAANTALWESMLNKIQASGGTLNQLTTFYSALYHSLMYPSTCSDVNGQYMGYDGNVHTTTNGRIQYANFSGWDIYRSECQLLAMIEPDIASDMAQSLVNDYQQGGAFPRWGVPNDDSGVMIGDPSAAIIADFYNFSAANFDTATALAGLLRAATDPSVKSIRNNVYERDALSTYINSGYVPEGQTGSGYAPVSMTLEYCTADFALSQFAEAMGDTVNSNKLIRRAQNWMNLFNQSTGYMQMKTSAGSWSTGFVNNNEYYSTNVRAYAEGSASQYTWMVPFNYNSLIALMGGPDITAGRLDVFFTNLNAARNSTFACMSNEPSFCTPWIYDFVGKPYKTQATVRNIMNQLFTTGSMPGADDLGEMSSWYVWSALGMYPELPGSNVLVLGSPLFQQAIIHLKNGDVTITGNGSGTNSPYVNSLSINGQTWNKPWLRFSDISDGGTLEYNLSSSPNAGWGSDTADVPPSYSYGTIPTQSIGLVSPASGDTLGVNDSLLVWKSVPGASSYEVQISYMSNFSGITIDSSNITDTLFNIAPYYTTIQRFPPPANKLAYNTKYYWRLTAENNGELISYSPIWSFVTPDETTGIKKNINNIPGEFVLDQNYPNPFNPSTRIKYSLPKESFVSLKVFNMLGQEVETLVSERQSAGTYEVNFNAEEKPSGVYLYRLRAGEYAFEKKMMFLK